MFFMTAPLSVFNCTEIAKSIVWPHGDCLVVFSHSLHRLPTKQILQKEKCEIPLGCSGSGKGGDASLRAQLLLKCCVRYDAAAGVLVLARFSFPQLNSLISCHTVPISPPGINNASADLISAIHHLVSDVCSSDSDTIILLC